MANVTKKDLVEKVSEKTGLNQIDTKIVVETLLNSIGRSLQEGKNIEIRGFGRFKIKKQKSHKARNPRTNEEVMVEDRYKPIFEASNLLRDRVNNAILGKKS